MTPDTGVDLRVADDVTGATGGESAPSAMAALLPALRRLDVLIARAVTAAEAAFGPEAAADPYRGLYVAPDDVQRLLGREPGTPTLWSFSSAFAEPPEPVSPGSTLAWLAQTFRLSPFDVDVLLVALAPELDLRYERLYGYLQDDVSRRRPTVDLALNMLCPSVEAKMAGRARFDGDAPLVRHRLVHLIVDPGHVQPPLLAHSLKLDDQVVRLLLGDGGLDPRLAAFCQLVTPAVRRGDSTWSGTARALATLVHEARAAGRPLRLYFHGPRGAGKRRTAEALATEVGAPLLAADLMRAVAADPDAAGTLRLVLREAWWHGAVLYLDAFDGLRGEERAAQYEDLLDALATDGGITILAGAQPWISPGHGATGMLTIPFGLPDVTERRDAWRRALTGSETRLDESDLDALASRFRMTPHQIGDAVATARVHARLQRLESAERGARAEMDGPTASQLFSAARAQSGQDLATLAHKIEPRHSWDDIVLPEDVRAQLREICQQVSGRDRVLDEWGFGRRLSLGKGINALFAGPPGTGKTMAAEVLAGALGIDLYKIDLAQVVDKYIGETEKRLGRIFAAAENANGVLFFDEADALFGKRSEVRDSHDRYANIEIAYLLQRMEQYEGIAILATNLRQCMDEAFTRRLQFIVEFPFPDERDRSRIWQRTFPPEAPRDTSLDYEALARLRLAGGNIKNIVLGAAYLAAADARPVAMEHLAHAARREYQKLGKPSSEADVVLRLIKVPA